MLCRAVNLYFITKYKNISTRKPKYRRAVMRIKEFILYGLIKCGSGICNRCDLWNQRKYSSEHEKQFPPKIKIPYLQYSYLQLEMNIYNNCRHQNPSRQICLIQS